MQPKTYMIEEEESIRGKQKMKTVGKEEEKYLEQRATTELAKGESWGMDLGESEGDESSSFLDFLRWKMDLNVLGWFFIKLSIMVTFTFLATISCIPDIICPICVIRNYCIWMRNHKLKKWIGLRDDS